MSPRSTTPCKKTTSRSSPLPPPRKPTNAARRTSLFHLALFTKRVCDLFSPVRKVIERLRVRRIEMQRRDGNGPGRNCRVIRIRLNVLVDSLFEQPEVTAAP